MNRTLSGDVQFEDGRLGISQCVWCRHRWDDGRRCEAFPDGIPEAIAENRYDHRDPYEGDRGVRFEPEQVEIEFLDVDEPASNGSQVALALAMARGADADGRDTDVIELDGEQFELDDGALTAAG